MKGLKTLATHVPERPKFSDDQITRASDASKKFGQLRTAAKDAPQYISASGKIDSVVLNYEHYLKMFQELEVYRELSYMQEISLRVEHSIAHPEDSLSLREAVGEESYNRIMSTDPYDPADDDLFE